MKNKKTALWCIVEHDKISRKVVHIWTITFLSRKVARNHLRWVREREHTHPLDVPRSDVTTSIRKFEMK